MPWQRCTWTERSSPGRGVRPSGRTASARRSDWSQPSRVSGRVGGGHLACPCSRRAEAALELALVAAERGEQRVPDPPVADVVASRRRARRRSASRCHRSSLGCGSHRCRSWWVAERAQQLDLGRGHPGVAEQRDPRRQVARPRPRAGRRVSACRAAGAGASTAAARARHSGGCQARSPSSGAAEAVGGRAGRPVGEQLRALGGVRREEPGEPARDGVAAAAAELGLVAGVAVAEVGGERRRPGLVQGGVEHRQQRPGQRVGRPRVVVAGAGQLGDQRAREAELDAGADAVAARRRTCRAGATAAGSATARRRVPGTSTSSVANGSSSGVDSSSPRASASRSVRGARWRWSAIGPDPMRRARQTYLASTWSRDVAGRPRPSSAASGRGRSRGGRSAPRRGPPARAGAPRPARRRTSPRGRGCLRAEQLVVGERDRGDRQVELGQAAREVGDVDAVVVGTQAPPPPLLHGCRRGVAEHPEPAAGVVAGDAHGHRCDQPEERQRPPTDGRPVEAPVARARGDEQGAVQQVVAHEREELAAQAVADPA